MIEPLTGPVIFEPGDVVALKSGGPAMTVIGVKEEGVQCLWYADVTDEVKTSVIPAICIEKALTWEDDEDEEDDSKHKKSGKKKRHDDE
ncbi:MAG TPA: DUF2158 domain-containing protein [Methylocella sp.]|jgi:uncharacterized protein YodC (DUF2158 family)